MLDVEAALASAEARAGVIPADAAHAIAACCRAELYDLDALGKAARNAGNLAIPLVAALTRKVGEDGSAAKGYVHWGATSQDIIDTGLVLQLRDALAAIERDVGRLGDALRLQIDRHRTTVMPGRTWLQQGLPTTLGLKLAGVLCALTRDRARLAALRPRLMVLQFGGAAGTLASLGDAGRCRRARAGRRARARRRAHTLAHAARRTVRARRDDRHPHGNAGQARARPGSPRPDGSRRSLRAGGARTRRLVDDAAEAQSGRRLDRDRRGGARARRSSARCSPPPCRSTSADSATGRPNGTRCPRSCAWPRARSTRWRKPWAASKSMRHGCARTSSCRGDRSSPRPSRWRSRRSSAATSRTSSSATRRSARRARAGISKTC